MAAPFVGNYTPEELDQGREFVKEWNPEKIQLAYIQGKISLADKSDMLRTYGQITHELRVREYAGTQGLPGIAAGEIQNYVMGVAKEFETAWKNAEDGDMKRAVFHSLMGGLSVFAYADIPGNVAERWALSHGMEPSYARALNWALWVPFQFIGITAALKAPFKLLGAAWKGFKEIPSVARNFGKYLKDPIEFAVKESMKLDAKALSKIKSEVAAGERAAGRELISTDIPPVSPQQIETAAQNGVVGFYEEKAKQFMRKNISHGQTEAESINKMSLRELLAKGPGEGSSAAEMAFMGRVNASVTKGFEDSLKEAMDNFDNLATRPDLLENVRMHIKVMGETIPRFLGAGSEGGRFLEYMKELQGEKASAQFYDTILKGLGSEVLGEGETQAFIRSIQKLALLMPESRQILLEGAAQTKAPGILHTFFKTLLFASPVTSVVNTLGQIQGGLTDALQFTASGLDIMKGAGAPTIHEVMAMWAGIGNASRNMPRLLRQAVERSSGHLEKIGLEGAQGKLAQYGTGRLLGIEDEFISGFLESGYVQALATKEALEQGLSGKALKAAVARTISNPNEVARLAEIAHPAVQHAMYHDPLSGLSESITKAIRNSFLDFWLPVLKFPVNALKVSRDWTPGLQMLSKQFLDDIAAGGARESAARSRVALSWMMAQYVWGQAKAGNITGGGPRNPDALAAWQQADPKKNIPYNMFGYNYRWAEPIASPIGFIADLAQLSNEMEPGNLEDALTVVVLSTSRMVTNNYWLRMLHSLDDIASNVGAETSKLALAAGKLALQPFKTVAQGGPLGRQFSEWANPQVSDKGSYGQWEDLSNWFLADTPWGMNSRPKLDLNANPLVTPPVLGQRWANVIAPPIRYSLSEGSQAAQFMQKHGVTVDDNWKSGPGSVDPDRPLATPGTSPIRPNLTGDEAYNWKILSLKGATNYSGKTWQERLNELDNDPNFTGLSQPKKQQRVNRVFNQYQKEGWKLILDLNPDVAAKAAAAKEETKIRKGLAMPQSEDLIDDGKENPVEYVPIEPPPGAGNQEGQITIPNQ